MSEPLKSIMAALLTAGLMSTAMVSPQAWAQSDRQAEEVLQPGDFIVAVVNQELVTAIEIEQRLARVRENAARAGQRLPPESVLRKQILEGLIDERAQLAFARESGPRIDDAELDRAVANVAAQNKVTMAQMREQLAREGIDFARFRKNVREQMLLEKVREREVQSRIRITDADVDALLAKQRADNATTPSYNLAQILIPVPESATDAEVARLKGRADAALARVRGGEAFEAVASELVADERDKVSGGELGLRPVERLPDAFVEHVRGVGAGQVAPSVLRTGAGFHLLKVVERRDGQAFSVTETHSRHILLRPTAQLDQAAAMRQLAEMKAQIVSGAATFEALAKERSEDGSAAQGGDLGWTTPGTFVPEFDDAMATLAIGEVSDPVISRFGIHLIQVLERRQASLDARQEREQARSLLREKKYEEAYAEWTQELRQRTYVEMREPPL
ncbi:MAG: peptidylprolyl isomerase [Burkholderiaceae bacterium]|nr:peptidylprolyl isomerase [Burkholderiaceae bacterium]